MIARADDWEGPSSIFSLVCVCGVTGSGCGVVPVEWVPGTDFVSFVAEAFIHRHRGCLIRFPGEPNDQAAIPRESDDLDTPRLGTEQEPFAHATLTREQARELGRALLDEGGT